MDGVSSMLLTAGSTEEFNKDYFVGVKEVPLWQQLYLKLSFPFYTVPLFLSSVFSTRDLNMITAGKKKMTGKLSISTSPKFKLADIKALSKKSGVTINDIVILAMCSGLKKYLKDKGDPCGADNVETDIQIMMPANLRWGFPKSKEDIHIENKFAALPIKMPLINNIKDSYKRIQKVTKSIKSQASFVYCSYAVSFYGTIFLPRLLPRLFVHNATMKFTCALSNTPGPIKNFKYTDAKGNPGSGSWAFPYIMCAGRCGLAISCMSYGEVFNINISADEGVMKDTDVLLQNMITGINDEIERMKDVEVPQALEKKKNN